MDYICVVGQRASEYVLVVPCFCRIFTMPVFPIGNLISVSAFGKLTIVVNSVEAARDLFEKRSSIYSDRPYNAMLEL